MAWAGSKPVPWTSRRDFVAWAASFSLRLKVLGGFLGVVVLVGLVTSLIGTRLARDTIMDQSRSRLQTDLATAQFVLDSVRENLNVTVKLASDSEKLKEMVKEGKFDQASTLMARVCVKNGMDFLSLADPSGKVLARAFNEAQPTGSVEKDPFVRQAMDGRGVSGFRLAPAEGLLSENPSLETRILRGDENAGLTMEASQPLSAEGKLLGVLYGGILLNGNRAVVQRISRLIFPGTEGEEQGLGQVTIYQKQHAVNTTWVDESGAPLRFEASEKIQEEVLRDDRTAQSVETRLDQSYLAATGPIVDTSGEVVGALEVATLEAPIDSVVDRLVGTFFIVGFLGVLLMAAITSYLVEWINRPLVNLLNAARAVSQGDLDQKVPVAARDELGELASTFNLMVRNLKESHSKLEEWGKELASKVALQTGELQQAQEQVARVRKLASLEKMADGMAHHMAHISDPLVATRPEHDDDQAGANRILVFDEEERILEMCSRILEPEGFHVVLARSADEALNELQQEIFDVMVAQIDVPDMDGKEWLKEIKYRQPDVLVIFTAPFQSTEDADEAVKSGAFDYLPKPFGPHQVQFMVYTALQTRAAVESTRHQLASQRAETIFQRLPVAIALADGAHRVVYHNQAFVDLAAKEGGNGITGRSFKDLFGVDPLDLGTGVHEGAGSKWLELEEVGRTAKLYNFKLPEEDLRVLMLLDITDSIKRDQEAGEFRAETITRAHQVIHQQMRVAQEIAGLLGETTAETKAALYELIKLAGEQEETG